MCDDQLTELRHTHEQLRTEFDSLVDQHSETCEELREVKSRLYYIEYDLREALSRIESLVQDVNSLERVKYL